VFHLGTEVPQLQKWAREDISIPKRLLIEPGNRADLGHVGDRYIGNDEVGHAIPIHFVVVHATMSGML
jgi:hypothetical protein